MSRREERHEREEEVRGPGHGLECSPNGDERTTRIGPPGRTLGLKTNGLSCRNRRTTFGFHVSLSVRKIAEVLNVGTSTVQRRLESYTR